MSQINIDSQDLGFRVLCYLIELAESGEIDQLIAAGFSPEIISALRQMTVNDVSSLAGTMGMMSLLINVTRFESAITARTRRINESQELTYFARAGATALLLSEVFRISLSEAEAHLTTLTTVDKRSGRPSMPDVSTPALKSYRILFASEAHFLDELAAAYSTLTDDEQGRAALSDARYADASVDENNVIDFGQWVSAEKNFSRNAALAFAPGHNLRAAERLYMYLDHLQQKVAYGG